MKINRNFTFALILSVVVLSLVSAMEVAHKKNKSSLKNLQFISKIITN